MAGASLPGFVDLQVNGFRGTDFSGPDLDETSFARACRELLNLGTGAFLPTVITADVEIYRRNLPLMADVAKRPEFNNRLLGFHIEGPFISRKPGAVGAHKPDWVRDPDLALLDSMIEWSGGGIRLLTIAPEVPGAQGLIRHAVSRGITVSLGHSIASGEDISSAVTAGAKALTHLGNAVPNMLPRHPNTIWEGLAEDRLSMMVIADGHHLPAATLKAMLRAKGVARSIVVSDASHLSGLPAGTYPYPGGTAVLEKSGLLHDPAKKCLVGSSRTMCECMNFLASTGWYGLEDMLKLGFHNPLALIGLAARDRNLPAALEFDPARGFVPAGG